MLTDQMIRRAIRTNELTIVPYIPDNVQPVSVDLTLAPTLLMRGDYDADWGQANSWHSYWLKPNRMILASTLEWIELPPYLVGHVTGKSSLARKGLSVHLTAGLIDPGFRGQVTLELINFSNRLIQLYPNMKIAQISFTETSNRTPVDKPYGHPELGSHYQNQMGPRPAIGD